MNNNHLEQFKKDFKRDALAKVIVGMKHGKISTLKAGEIARGVLEAFSYSTKKEIFEKLLKMSEESPQILDIIIQRGEELDTREKEEKLEEIHIYLMSDLKGGVN